MLLLPGCQHAAKPTQSPAGEGSAATSVAAPAAIAAPPVQVVVARVKAPHCLALDAKGCATKCTAGDVVSCTRLASIGTLSEAPSVAQGGVQGGAQGGAPGTGPTAVARRMILGDACNARYGAACMQLSVMLGSGAGGVADPAGAAFIRTAALALLPAECDAGDGESCGLLAEAYASGEGVPKDAEIAKQLAARVPALQNKACGAGDASSCSTYGLDVSSKNVNDAKTGAVYLKKGCDGGDGLGCESLAQHYAAGRGVTKDPKQAKALLKKACTSGLSRACTK